MTPTVGAVMADANPTQVNVRAAGDVRSRVGHALGLALPVEPNTVASSGERSILWLGPDEWLVIDQPGMAGEIEATVRAAFAPNWGSVVDVSANRVIFELSGPHARNVLAHGCSLDLHPRGFGPGMCAQTLLAKTTVILWQTDDAPTFRIFVRASYVAHLTRWLEDATAYSP
jgi:sarcosine oxidase, subunit gamma